MLQQQLETNTVMQKQDLQVTRERENPEENIARTKVLRWQHVGWVEELKGVHVVMSQVSWGEGVRVVESDEAGELEGVWTRTFSLSELGTP